MAEPCMGLATAASSAGKDFLLDLFSASLSVQGDCVWEMGHMSCDEVLGLPSLAAREAGKIRTWNFAPCT